MTASLLSTGRPFDVLGRRLGARTEVMAQLWGASMHGLARWWHSHPEVPRQDLVQTVIDALWTGLAGLLGASEGEASGAERNACGPSECVAENC